MRSLKRLSWLVVAALPIVAVFGPHSVSQAQGAASLVKTASARILVTPQGMTLYLYTPDKHNQSVCTGTCAKYWPPLLLPAGAKAPKSMPGVQGTFGVAMRANGAHQLTFDGAPLYTFIEDKKPGDMTGQGLQNGTWWVVVTGGK